jgi:acetyltransferase
VALKILSPDITHKSDVGGVVLDLESAEAVQAAAEAMRRRIHELNPHAVLTGYTVQTMARRAHGRELIVGVATDRVFGPVILFGQGGTAVEVTADRAIGLPPLNNVLARDLISHTRVARLLGAYRNTPAADLDAICRALIQVSQMVIDLPEIIELDINPLLASDEGVIALDARVHIGVPASVSGRLAIRPYPAALEERIEWHGESLLLRPIKPEDGQAHIAFFNTLDPEDIRFRLFTRVRELVPSQLARMTQIDYDREMAFIAVRDLGEGRTETLGVARAIADPDNIAAEFAVIVRSDLKGRGLGRILMRKLIDYCRQRGTREIVGETLSHNSALIDLVRSLGFEVKPMLNGDGTMHLRLPLHDAG